MLGKRAFTAIKFSEYWTHCLVIYYTPSRNLREQPKFSDPLKNDSENDESLILIGFRLTLVCFKEVMLKKK